MQTDAPCPVASDGEKQCGTTKGSESTKDDDNEVIGMSRPGDIDVSGSTGSSNQNDLNSPAT